MSDVSALPPPPVPAYLDMTGNDWFPLHHQRLSDNAWWQTASHVARSCHIDLLLKAYRQVPAGSLPDDERELAVACGLHRDLETFRAIRGELLETWVLCADGRWYQPELAATCLETWERLDEKRRGARERKALQRARAGETGAMSRVTPPPVPRDIDTQDKTEQDRTTDSVVPAAPKPAKGWEEDAVFGSAWDACTKQMRQRSKSRDLTWPLWKKAAAAVGPDRLLAALKAYLKGHRDLERTGGPGLHKWLSDGVYDHWLPAEPSSLPPYDPLEEWRAIAGEFTRNSYWPGDMGPKPGRDGCRCPPEVLAELGLPHPGRAEPHSAQPSGLGTGR